MSHLTVLMVAEKPSIAQTLADVLCHGSGDTPQKRKGVSPSSPVYEYRGIFRGFPAKFKVTATTGHVYSLDFSKECQNWDSVQPGDLFHADTVRCYDPRARMPEHIQTEARGADVLVLWLDCDREGENICFEVIGEALQTMRPSHSFPEAYQSCIFRAQFSSLAAVDLQAAMNNLGVPDIRQSHSVDARQEIDLRLGVAFSRLQTLYFRKHFGNQLGKKMVTYGPCQFPTLWFCVQRHCEIEAFVPAPFWQMTLTASTGSLGCANFECHRAAGEYWSEYEATNRLQELKTGGNRCKIQNVRKFSSKIKRPLPLNTVSLLRMASDELGLGPGDALHFAEQLYLKGITSYPRTETNRYPENFDLEGTARVVANPAAPWAGQARQLLERGITAPREDGFDAGDHPPITPVKFTASPAQCGGEAGYVLYCAICTHFLATISPDCLFDEVEMQLDFCGESFLARSSRCRHRGWLDIDNRTASDTGNVDLRTCIDRDGAPLEELVVVDVELTQHYTKPPGHIRESELLELMERHQIGTDASMATHVSNVQKRAYVSLNEESRQLIPSALGLALANAYALIDQGLILPRVRARIENQCNSVAKGEATKDVVIKRAIRNFERKFHNFAMKIDRLPLMLAVAHAEEKGGGQVAGDAVGEGLKLWAEAKAFQCSINLEALLEERDSVEMDDDEEEGDIPSPIAATRLVEERTPAVERVQQALEQLGFGPAAEIKTNTKGKAQGASHPSTASQSSANVSQNSPVDATSKQVSSQALHPEDLSQVGVSIDSGQNDRGGKGGGKNDNKNGGKSADRRKDKGNGRTDDKDGWNKSGQMRGKSDDKNMDNGNRKGKRGGGTGKYGDNSDGKSAGKGNRKGKGGDKIGSYHENGGSAENYIANGRDGRNVGATSWTDYSNHASTRDGRNVGATSWTDYSNHASTSGGGDYMTHFSQADHWPNVANQYQQQQWQQQQWQHQTMQPGQQWLHQMYQAPYRDHQLYQEQWQ